MRKPRFISCVVFFIITGCGAPNPAPQNSNHPSTPESAYRQLMLAMLECDEKAIRTMILDNPDAAILWQGGRPPKEVAALLAEQYRTMDISRAEGAGDINPGRVVLHSSAFPLPLTVVNVGSVWKVDGAPIIDVRKAADKIRSATH